MCVYVASTSCWVKSSGPRNSIIHVGVTNRNRVVKLLYSGPVPLQGPASWSDKLHWHHRCLLHAVCCMHCVLYSLSLFQLCISRRLHAQQQTAVQELPQCYTVVQVLVQELVRGEVLCGLDQQDHPITWVMCCTMIIKHHMGNVSFRSFVSGAPCRLDTSYLQDLFSGTYSGTRVG